MLIYYYMMEAFCRGFDAVRAAVMTVETIICWDETRIVT